jgi:hypothetical protein
MTAFNGLPYGETLTLISRTLATDVHGDVVRDEYGQAQYEDVEMDIPGCSVSPAGAMGQPFSRELNTSLVSTKLMAYIPSWVIIDPDDRLIYRGHEYEVDGELGYSHSPFSNRNGPSQVFLKRSTG